VLLLKRIRRTREKMILFINACVWDESRTKRLADHLLSMMDEPVTEIRLIDEEFPTVDIQFLDKRERLKESGDYSDPMFRWGKQFASADTIVIAAPYWDLSFPAALKTYFEQINVLGVTFDYSADGIPRGLCKAKKLYYITTSGGDFAPDEFGYGYVDALAKNYYGIKETKLIKATGLDLVGADPEMILKKCMDEMDEI
jgi:FMN-dependent NADH-azoreductase